MNQPSGTGLLLDCLTYTNLAQSAATLTQCSPDDWESLWEAAARHGLAPLLCYRLKEQDALNLAPSRIADKLRNSLYLSTQRNVHKFQELGGVLSAFNHAGIRLIPLKGAHLAALVYPDPALRPMGDLDLLVPREQLEEGAEIITGLGYRASRAYQVDDECTRMQHLPPMNKDGHSTIEIHWAISKPHYPFMIDQAALWDSAVKTRITAQPAWVLSNENLLMHLALHTSYQHHFNSGLKPFCDIAELLLHHREKIDWGRLTQDAKEWGLAKSLYLTLTMVEDLLQVNVPRAALGALEPGDFNPEVVSVLREHVLAGHPDLTINLAEIMDEAGSLDKVTRLWRRIFIPPETLAREYNVSPHSLRLYGYYLVRLKRVVQTHTGDAGRMLFGDRRTIVSARCQNEISALIKWMEPL